MKKKNRSLFVSLKDFASTCYTLLKSDRDVTLGVAGFTGEGKTRFTDAFLTEYAKVSGTYWDFDRMTWSRKELLEWIDGKRKSEVNKKTGLKENQLPEYSGISPDELFYMFYKRNWFDQGQIDAVSTFNMCRDRHLLIIGNVPDLWDLDASFLKRLRFYVFIPERGRAWVFQQENNPFSKDSWNVAENRKIFRKYLNPYAISNFVCEIKYTDWDTERKQEYYKVRNVKRVKALQENKNAKEHYADIKAQRNTYMEALVMDRIPISDILTDSSLIDPQKINKLIELGYNKRYTNEQLADIGGLSREVIRLIRHGDR